jgi:hypothetical protein
MKRASYREGVAWIALNDEPTQIDASVIAEMISVTLLADLFGVSPERVAADIVKARLSKIAGNAE